MRSSHPSTHPGFADVQASITYRGHPLSVTIHIDIGDRSPEGEIDCAFELREATLGGNALSDDQLEALMAGDRELVESVSNVVSNVVTELLSDKDSRTTIH